MSTREVTELTCALCSKNFDKHASLKRHGYYCRSKPASQRASRGKCCIPCARAKVRCDTSRTPACSRCIAKNLDCQYGNKRNGNKVNPGAVLVDSPHRDMISATLEPISEDVVAFQQTNSFSSEQFNFDHILDDNWSLINGNHLIEGDWSRDLLSTEVNLNQEQRLFSFSPMLGYSSPARSVSSPRPMQLSNQKQFPTPEIPRFLRPFGSRLRLNSSLKVTGVIPMRMLYSYPKMMLRPETFPPFVHPQFFPSDRDGILEPIANCMSLMQLYEVGNRNSRKMPWRTIRFEQARLTDEHETYSGWELIAAMQASLIYVLLRLAEGETEHNDVDLPLVSSMGQMTKTFVESFCYTTDESVASSPNRDWRQWLFEESYKRTSVIFRILDALLNLKTTVCALPADFVLVPLPARRLLWEASTAEIWRAELGKGGGTDDDFGLRSDGELARVNVSMGYALTEYGDDKADGSKRNWQDWCAGVDGFGSLIMTAASMLST